MKLNQLVEQIEQIECIGETERTQLCKEIMKLPYEEFEQLGRTILEKGLKDNQQYTLKHLITMRPQDATTLQLECICQGIYNAPPTIYHQAKPEVREVFLQKIGEAIEKEEFVTISEVLEAWVSIGDEVVQKQISTWISNPPSWEGNLSIPLEEYTYYGGWRWDQKIGKVNLTFSEGGYTAQKKDSQTLQNEICHDCGNSLTVLFDFNLQDSELQFLGILGERLQIATCIECTCDQTLYFHVDGAGNVRWYEGNSTYLGISQHELNFELGAKNQIPCYQLGRKLESWEDFSLKETKIGGHPYWIQNPVFPKCPTCNQEMPLLAQYRVEDEEGMIYINICSTCKMIATERMQI